MGTLLRGQSRKCLCCFSLIPLLALICMFFILRSSFIVTDYQTISRCNTVQSIQSNESVHSVPIIQSNACESNCDPSGSVALPRGIVSKTSDLERRSLWGSPLKVVVSKSLLAMPVGIKQKEIVDQIVKKFLPHNFTIMLFHYDGVVDEWKDLEWSSDAIHVAATDQTKWWFAKRFLHPDIVSEYNYIFLWDEDLGVENFHPKRYLSIIQEEGLEISQPALGVSQLRVHHQITARGRSKFHRRTYKFTGGTTCNENSTNPPCTGWVEMMAPVFSKASWRCVWHMIQNDLIHAWGLDMKLGYCAQGDRTLSVGVVDAEYIVHKGIPSLGGQDLEEANSEAPSNSSNSKSLQKHERPNARRSVSMKDRYRYRVRRRSYHEQNIFNHRWRRAVDQDKCWRDPYPRTTR